VAVGVYSRPPLPAELPAAEREFFAELRRLAGVGSLSQRDLEGLTAAAGPSAYFSRSSWARALRGQARPPLHAVRALAAHLGDGVGAEALPDLWARAFAPPPPRQAEHAPALPWQLPPSVPHFTGRAAEIRALDRLACETAAAGGALVVSAIGGTAGVGKTALAVHWAHRIAGRFPDGQLYVNLRGYDPSDGPVEPAETIRGFLEALGVSAAQLPASRQAQAGLYRSLLAGKQMLILLDNARDPGQVRPLLPGAPGCLVLVTSRSQMTGLAAADGARLITLDLLSEDEARALLARRLGAGRVTADPGAADGLLALCAGLPLAINIAAARAAARPGRPLGELTAGLAGESSRLDALDTGEAATSVRAVFSWSYQSLGQPAARMFRLLSLHPGPDITAAAAASLAGTSAGHATGILRDLAAAHLITEHAPARFTFHDLLRAYAAEQAAADSEPDRRAAAGRVLDHYLHTAHRCAALLCPGRELLTLAPAAPGVMPERRDDSRAALAWFTAERRVLAAVITRAADTGLSAAAWRLGWTFGRFLHRAGYRQEWLVTLHTALAAAEGAADLAGQAYVHRDLGGAYADQGCCREAEVHLQRAMALFEALGDVSGRAHTLLYLGRMFDAQGRIRETLAPVLEARQLFRSVRHTAGQANALTNAALAHCALGEHEKALAYCQQALELHRESGNRDAEGYAWACLGDTYYHLGRHELAIDSDRRSAALFRELGAGPLLAWALTQLGDHLRGGGRPQDAYVPWQQALTILDRLQHPDAEQVRGRLSQPAAAASRA
jgi:tetratricopeptide (TPR) repeat protein